MALNLAHFGRWTLRDKAAQRRSSPVLSTALVLAARLGYSCFVTVNSVLGLIFSSGLACFSAARHFPFATSGRGYRKLLSVSFFLQPKGFGNQPGA
jgi:hypothetical protein